MGIVLTYIRTELCVSGVSAKKADLFAVCRVRISREGDLLDMQA